MPYALLVEDDPQTLRPLVDMVKQHGYKISTASTLHDARLCISEKPLDLVLLDLSLPDGNAIELLRELSGEHAPNAVLLMGDRPSESALEGLSMEASEFLTKPVDLPKLKAVLANLSEVQRGPARSGNGESDVAATACSFGPLLGSSPTMKRVYELVKRVAPTEASVLLTGETGTGKDLVARTVHRMSLRRKKRFWPVNCGAIPANLMESELFGHERGSFTGADRMHKGHFERASGGTLFLDEISEMPAELQVKLLRVLETGKIIRVGGDQELDVDVRVVAATNREPALAVREGKLREDLMYRLAVFPVPLPPLRERGEDVQLLARHFLQQINQASGTNKEFEHEALRRLSQYEWPGNVRELRNVVHRAYILADESIGSDCLPTLRSDTRPHPNGSTLNISLGMSIAEAERQLILSTLEHCGGDKQKTADVLGVSLKTLYNRLNSYKLPSAAAAV